jgi:hypothetical protein
MFEETRTQLTGLREFYLELGIPAHLTTLRSDRFTIRFLKVMVRKAAEGGG